MTRTKGLWIAAMLGWPLAAHADEPIRDNSFLIEEAYNQEAGVVQHISTFELSPDDDTWSYGFTQEWPVLSQIHQVSVTVPLGDAGGDAGLGDVGLNYRAQLSGIGGGAVAFAPRVSVVLPTGAVEQGMGDGGLGLQLNLPVSTEVGGRLALHGNLGAALVAGGEGPTGASGTPTSLWAGASAIWLVHAKFNLMTELLWTETGTVVGPDQVDHAAGLVVSPGLRAALDLGDLQIVPGLAVPIGLGPSAGEVAVFGYLSFEHPFSSAAK